MPLQRTFRPGFGSRYRAERRLRKAAAVEGSGLDRAQRSPPGGRARSRSGDPLWSSVREGPNKGHFPAPPAGERPFPRAVPSPPPPAADFGASSNRRRRARAPTLLGFRAAGGRRPPDKRHFSAPASAHDSAARWSALADRLCFGGGGSSWSEGARRPYLPLSSAAASLWTSRSVDTRGGAAADPPPSSPPWAPLRIAALPRARKNGRARVGGALAGAGKETDPSSFCPGRRRRSSADAAYKSRARALFRHPLPPAVARAGLASQRRRAPPLLSPPASAAAVAAGHGLARARRPARAAVRPGRPAGLCAPAQKVHAGRLSPAAGALSLLV